MGGVLIQVKPSHRMGRGRYYRPKSCGYTDTVLRAGVFTREYAADHVRGEGHKLEVAEDPLGREPGATVDYPWTEEDRELDAYLYGLRVGRGEGHDDH